MKEKAKDAKSPKNKKGLRRKKNRKRFLLGFIMCGLMCIFIMCSILGTGVDDSLKTIRLSKGSQLISEAVEDAIEKMKEDGYTSKGYKMVTINGVSSINGIIIANKTYSLPETYGDGLTSATETAFNEMKNAAAEDGITLEIVSGFRSYDTQQRIYNEYVANDGQEAADTYSARPGHSEHQLGEALDLNKISQSFAETDAYAWLQKHAVEYGFILRYPPDSQEITGYINEPWHYRYVGTELASEVYNDGDWITLEEYFGIDSKYAD